LRCEALRERDIIVELGKTEGKLPKREQSRLESFAASDRIRVIIIKVEKTAKGPQVIVSRTDPAWCSISFKRKCPKSTTGPCRSKAPPRGRRTNEDCCLVA